MDKNTPSTSKGTLYIVATPIGNMEDITLRALRTLKEVNLIAAEDTRRTRILLNHYSIKTPLTSYYEYNKLIKGKKLIDRLGTGENIALVSDAGTPGISDPGYHLIKLAPQSSISVIPIPGVSAVITALSVSGLPTDSFVFQGFLPNKVTARKKLLEKMAEEKRTLVFYESPNRLRAALQDLLEICGDREIVVTRELTKVFEEVIRGEITHVLTVLNGRQIKGEITLLVSGKRDPDSGDDTSIPQLLQDYQKRYGLPMKALVRMISEEKGISKREVYQESLRLKKEKMFA
ncbi:MAG: 16S rRNA (cytidine(1402)-2'-O)-methyltransferase [Deltaproteobacteria bacterium CG12_big_fil_rev_8_21_14_0_65_43_10]|nr:MAG: 16S rRNA (cytidine(1402)-2'-O)-methyltransferase [Deltaproteobacteria bacterium CG2_30_43_15]PIQ45370.1 MAG: 16S rRNA (cytidine(1402)-2'-O)-methyltransferase [Deltaproteobacteria bacterium CG12_big_fil_rev_8_21_14_0_65_43_10]PIU86622.1 MAG: 16S rRNA (cytidine(1402)-2'-O)-methyltransferase [Deltaproteobacteria bacterium CG06_land_8_20_14_3_00_44_19]PIX26707.1 MAG: 16S rRNA (cytidine(1402)-2'-O)-methyltransferase [Deltaproteobacteria bacterium CG_4_8_14_3_um_filter_43_13]PJB44752.1 MAG: 1